VFSNIKRENNTNYGITIRLNQQNFDIGSETPQRTKEGKLLEIDRRDWHALVRTTRFSQNPSNSFVLQIWCSTSK